MKKLFLIPVLAIVMGLAWTAISTPDANAKDHRRYDRHDRHDRYDRYDRDHDRRGHKWNRGHGKVHKWTPPGHRVRKHARHRGHDRYDRDYDRKRIRHRSYKRHDRHDYRRYRTNRYRHHDHDSTNFSLSVVLPILDAFASSGDYRY